MIMHSTITFFHEFYGLFLIRYLRVPSTSPPNFKNDHVDPHPSDRSGDQWNAKRERENGARADGIRLNAKIRGPKNMVLNLG
ncbi:hypothetical protein V1478_000872 [Vespula squamosa]|uniref:Uncharacterized protein n=1 Tax=Vespula squamosa TaxID=30214 RepID=A0ABD2C6Q5_VESSQ